MPPHSPESFTSSSQTGAVGVSFSGHRRAVWEHGVSGLREADIVPGAAFVFASGAGRWLHVSEPADSLEVYMAPSALAAAAEELGAARAVALPDVPAAPDPVIWSIAVRFRRAVRTGVLPDDLQASALVHQLALHVLRTYGGIPSRVGRARRLGRVRLQRVVDYIDAHLADALTLPVLAAVAALSPFHFSRSFRATTGLTPHGFVVARRMDAARRLCLATTLPTPAIAAQVGYANVAHFRSSFVRQFGVTPALLRLAS